MGSLKYEYKITVYLTGRCGNTFFRGSQISILYDPGNFPALLENSSSSKLVSRNGGVPQLGDLTRHLKEFRSQLDLLVPDKNNDGIIVIDFESWRPTFRQNFGVLKPYQSLSMQLEQNKSSYNIPKKELEKRATKEFESAGKTFMLESLREGKRLRPNARWGYYAFPYCFNGRKNNPEQCPSEVTAENRDISWLFKNTDIILPSVYMSEKMPMDYRVKMVKGRVAEAKKMSMYSRPNNGQIYTYIRYCYTDTLNYLEEHILINAMDAMVRGGSEGVILWGSSNDLNTRYCYCGKW